MTIPHAVWQFLGKAKPILALPALLGLPVTFFGSVLWAGYWGTGAVAVAAPLQCATLFLWVIKSRVNWHDFVPLAVVAIAGIITLTDPTPYYISMFMGSAIGLGAALIEWCCIQILKA